MNLAIDTAWPDTQMRVGLTLCTGPCSGAAAPAHQRSMGCKRETGAGPAAPDVGMTAAHSGIHHSSPLAQPHPALSWKIPLILFSVWICQNPTSRMPWILCQEPVALTWMKIQRPSLQACWGSGRRADRGTAAGRGAVPDPGGGAISFLITFLITLVLCRFSVWWIYTCPSFKSALQGWPAQYCSARQVAQHVAKLVLKKTVH